MTRHAAHFVGLWAIIAPVAIVGTGPLVDWAGPLTAPPRHSRDAGHRDCFTETEGRRLLDQLSRERQRVHALAAWVDTHGGDPDEICETCR